MGERDQLRGRFTVVILAVSDRGEEGVPESDMAG